MPPRYKDIEECRPKIKSYARSLRRGTDEDDEELRNEESTKRYLQDLRWFDHWLDDRGVETASEVDSNDAYDCGLDLGEEFNGPSGLYRWDRLNAFYDWMQKRDFVDSNPFERWNDDKKQEFGLTKSTKQSKVLDDDDTYILSQEEVRKMEESVQQHRLRNQLIIRYLFQTGVRRQEASRTTLDMIDTDAREVDMPARICKNDKRRVVTYQPSLDGLMNQWLNTWRYEYTDYSKEEIEESDEYELGLKEPNMALFIGERGGRLRPESINDVVVKAADSAGINEKMYADANSPDGEPNRWKISAHSLRAGLATYLVNETSMDIYAVSKFLGHSSVDVTEDRYVEYDPRTGVQGAKQYGPD